MTEDIIRMFNKKHSDRVVMQIMETDDCYIIVALRDPSNRREMDPFFLMEKDGSDVVNFVPTMNQDLFNAGLRNIIYERK